jgi:hypothetical protein
MNHAIDPAVLGANARDRLMYGGIVSNIERQVRVVAVRDACGRRRTPAKNDRRRGGVLPYVIGNDTPQSTCAAGDEIDTSGLPWCQHSPA